MTNLQILLLAISIGTLGMALTYWWLSKDNQLVGWTKEQKKK